MSGCGFQAYLPISHMFPSPPCILVFSNFSAYGYKGKWAGFPYHLYTISISIPVRNCILVAHFWVQHEWREVSFDWFSIPASPYWTIRSLMAGSTGSQDQFLVRPHLHHSLVSKESCKRTWMRVILVSLNVCLFCDVWIIAGQKMIYSTVIQFTWLDLVVWTTTMPLVPYSNPHIAAHQESIAFM